MNKADSNLYYKILKIIKDNGVNSFKNIAKTLEISEELLKIIVQSLTKKGYINKIDEMKVQNINTFTCKFCSFANECSERVPKIFYQISLNGKKILEIKKAFNHV